MFSTLITDLERQREKYLHSRENYDSRVQERGDRFEDLCGSKLGTHSNNYTDKVEYYKEKEARNRTFVDAKLAKVERQIYEAQVAEGDRQNELWDIGICIGYTEDSVGEIQEVERPRW